MLRGYEPNPPQPEPDSETGFTLLGFGACRNAHQQYPPWGSFKGDNAACAAKCMSDASCVAYMSTQNGDYCQFYCDDDGDVGDGGGGGGGGGGARTTMNTTATVTETAPPSSPLCTEPGTAPGSTKLTTTDGSQDGALLRYCWLKT